MTICVYGHLAEKKVWIKLFSDKAAATDYPERYVKVLRNEGYDAELLTVDPPVDELYSDCNELFDDETGEYALTV